MIARSPFKASRAPLTHSRVHPRPRQHPSLTIAARYPPTITSGAKSMPNRSESRASNAPHQKHNELYWLKPSRLFSTYAEIRCLG
eukprot:scaffold312233_cov37-Tisochrysis_lutea.AAC.3